MTVRRFIAVILFLTSACSRIGDDRFPKVADAPPLDAVSVTPDAAGPVDAPSPVDAAASER